ncbi:MAG: LysM peptidoglycan-binding domain-containing protein [Syntrophomonadaceae bacterium]|nr:LysM peptidoglycan-binding domain-containing protein [Syntrophomonadaceae bacterium]MDD4549502.1 LysM peptidoglycan-binding domain-containing protein [Syntrophomonadaceae bacterium]
MKNKFYLTTVAVIFITTFFLAGVITSPQQAQAAYGDQLIKWGSKRQNVSIFQSDLTNLGFNTYGTEGIFGFNSFNDVSNFQKVSGIKADGIAGPMTKTTLTGKESGGITHQVQWGDSLNKLAAKYSTTVSSIMKANYLNHHTIYVGEILIIPATTSVTKHTVPGSDDSADIADGDCSDTATNK